MCFYDLQHISWAPKADSYVVFAELFIKFIVFWEVFSQKVEKFFSYICWNLVVESRIIPNDVTFYAFLFICLLIFICVFNLAIMFSLLHCFDVDRGGFFEIFLSWR